MSKKPRSWACLHCHSDASLLDCINKPAQIIKRAKELELNAVAITDHGNNFNCVALAKEAKKQKFKVINGLEFYIGHAEHKQNSHLVVLAKNLTGWKNLIKATSRSNLPDKFYRKPRLFLEDFGEYADGLVTFSGHPGSDLANVIFYDLKGAYGAKTYEQAKTYIDPDWKKKAARLVEEYRAVFGRENFFLEIQLIDQENLPAAKIIGQALRYLAKKLNCPTVATADSHYINKQDARDQRILLCTNLNTTLQEVERKIQFDEEFGLSGFFRSNNYHIPTLEEINELHTEEEIDNSVLIADMCEEYSILNKPILPQFDCPDGMSADQYLKNLCRDGWKSKIKNIISEDKIQTYADRVKMELGVLQGAGLSAYFLVVQDYVNWAISQGQLVGNSRGSAGGCLVSYLLGITGLDPIPYDLLFERFYNSGRNSKDHVSLPDIDIDFETNFRPKVIEYLKKKYGDGHVAQMITIGRMMGRGVLKDVFRANSVCGFDEVNRITEYVPDESEISDQLQLMREDGEEPSIIKWALENNAKQLKEWCYLDDDGNCQGQYANYFSQAIRLEATKRSCGKHAAGIVISPSLLSESAPMMYDKTTKELIVGLDMNSLEAMGMTKFDLLGTTCLDKIHRVSDLLSKGNIEID